MRFLSNVRRWVRHPRRSAPYRPRLEPLEDRLQPGSVLNGALVDPLGEPSLAVFGQGPSALESSIGQPDDLGPLARPPQLTWDGGSGSTVIPLPNGHSPADSAVAHNPADSPSRPDLSPLRNEDLLTQQVFGQRAPAAPGALAVPSAPATAPVRPATQVPAGDTALPPGPPVGPSNNSPALETSVQNSGGLAQLPAVEAAKPDPVNVKVTPVTTEVRTVEVTSGPAAGVDARLPIDIVGTGEVVYSTFTSAFPGNGNDADQGDDIAVDEATGTAYAIGSAFDLTTQRTFAFIRGVTGSAPYAWVDQQPHTWRDTANDSSFFGTGIATGPNGTLFVVGTAYNHASGRYFIFCEWMSFQTSGWAHHHCIVLDSPLFHDQAATLVRGQNNDFFVTGASRNATGPQLVYMARMLYNPATLQLSLGWSATLDLPGDANFGYNISGDTAGNAYVTGTADGQLFVLRFNPVLHEKTGLPQGVTWTRFFGPGVGSGINVAPDGSVHVTGRVQSLFATDRTDLFLAKLSAKGDDIWVQRFSEPGGDLSGSSIRVDALGHSYVAGSRSVPVGPGVFDTDGFVYKFAPDGSGFTVLQTFGNAGPAPTTDRAVGIALRSTAADTDVFVTGWTESPSFMPIHPMPGASLLQPTFGGVRDGFMTRLRQGPVIIIDVVV